MATVVTVPGASPGTTLTYTLNNAFNGALAQSIANALAAASTGGTLHQTAVASDGSFSANKSGGTGELVMTPSSGSPVNVGLGSGYQFLIDDLNAGTDVMSGVAGLSIMGGDGAHTVNNADMVVLGDGNNVVNETDPSITYNVAVGNGSNTLVGSNSGTLAGGTGTNIFNVSGGTGVSSNVVLSEGSGDSILGGSGFATVDASGTSTVGSTIRAGAGSLVVNDSGRKIRIIGGKAGTLSVNNTGTGMGLFGSNSGTTTVVDSGKGGSTINAGTGDTFVTQTGGAALIFGNASSASGSLNVFATSSNSTISDASGSNGAFNVTLGGSSNATAVVAGAGATQVSVGSSVVSPFIFAAGSVSGSTLGIDDTGTGTAVVTDTQFNAAFNVTAAGSGGGFFPIGSGAVTALVSGTGEEVATNFGTSALTATVTGSKNPLIVGNSVGGANITITGAGTSNSIFPVNSGSAIVNVTDQGSGDQLNSGYGTGTANFLLTGSTGANVLAGAGTTNVTLQGSGGNSALLTNIGGTLNFVGGSGAVTVQAFGFFGGAGGSTSIFGGSDGSNILWTNASGAGPATYTAGSGNETLDASTSTTNDTLGAGVGNATISGGSGKSLYLFDKNVIDGVGSTGAASDVVNNVTKGGSSVLLANYGAGEAATALATAQTVGGNTTIILTDGTSIVFNNTTKAQLTGILTST